MLYQLVQAGYWLALSTWFGGAVFVMLAAAVVFRTLREEKPVLPQVLAVNLEDQHATLLGSAVMLRLLLVVGKVQLVSALVVVMGAGMHFGVADVNGQNQTAAILRVVLAVVAAGVVAYERWVVAPRLARNRQSYIDHADDPDTANPAKDAFDRDQQLSLTLLLATVCLLVGLVLFSSAITPAGTLRTLVD